MKKINNLKRTIEAQRTSIQKKIKCLHNNEKKLAQLLAKDSPHITDHAVIRYLERVHDVNIEALKRQMLTEGDITNINMGCTKIKKGGHCYVVENKTVVMVI